MVQRIGDRNVGRLAKGARARAGKVFGKLTLELPQHRCAQRGYRMLEVAGDQFAELLLQQPAVDAGRILETAAGRIAVPHSDAGSGLDELAHPSRREKHPRLNRTPEEHVVVGI